MPPPSSQSNTNSNRDALPAAATPGNEARVVDLRSSIAMAFHRSINAICNSTYPEANPPGRPETEPASLTNSPHHYPDSAAFSLSGTESKGPVFSSPCDVEEMSSNGVEWTLNEAMTSSTDQPHIKEEAMPSTILYSNEREGLSRDSGNCSVPLVRSATETATWTSSHHHSDLANSLAKAESQDTASSEPSYGDAISSNGVEWTLKQASCTSTDQSDFTKSDDDASTVATTPPEDELEKTNYRRGIFQVVLLLLVVIAGTFVFYTMRQKHTNRESSEKSAIESGTNAAPSPLPTTIAPSETPTTAPSFAPTKYRHKVVTFAALGDIPYSDEEHETLRAQMDAMDATSGVAFVIHVGDIRLAGGREHCHRSEYEDVAETLARSAVPVLIIKGDNDSWDCGNYDEANEFWAETFVGFEQRHWDLPFEVKHNPEIPETFYFVYQDVLFIATDVVGGDPHDDDVLADWEAHLESQIVWALQLIRDYDIHMGHYTGRVIIFGHADPGVSHNAFFEPLQRFMEETNNRIPILYLNGDGHKWAYDPGFHDTPSLMRIMVRGEGAEPPTLIRVLASGDDLPIELAFEYDRQS